MKVCLIAALTAAALTACTSGYSQTNTAASQQNASEKPEPATTSLSEQFVLHSDNADRNFLIQVAAPIYAAPPNPDARVPVIYVTDGFPLFGITSSISRMLPFERLSDFAYVVAIGYPTDSFMELGELRSRDLIHVEADMNGAPFGGGGAAFEAFLLKELRPLIEGRYPVDPHRSVLAGHSLGGLFAATVLKNHPDAFDAYLIGSPSMQFDPLLADQIQAIAHEGGGRRIFIGVGALEKDMSAHANALEKALAVPGSTFATRRVTFDSETHVSVMGALITHGLQYVLPPSGAGDDE